MRDKLGRFVKGCKMPEDMKKKSSNGRKGILSLLKGKRLSEEHKRKISITMIGRKRPKEFCERLREVNLGKKHSDETKKKLSELQKGLHRNRDTEFKKGQTVGSKNYNWRGGKSFEKYSINWTKTLKRSIRERDNFTCQKCGKEQKNKLFSVHHIDYNKKNCNPENLITLCRSCHMKTNFNRKIWIKYFLNRKDESPRIDLKGGKER